jgi:uncharacterized protein
MLELGRYAMSDKDNKTLIQAGFDAWARGEGDFYSLLADNNAIWTITGSSPVAGTFYSRQEFLDGAVQPVFQRLSQPLRPTVKTIVAEGITQSPSGRATRLRRTDVRTTTPTAGSCACRMEREATAFFDAPLLTDLFERIRVGT